MSRSKEYEMSFDSNDEASRVRRASIIWGVICILFGAVFFCNTVLKIEIFSIAHLWPLFVLVPGLAFEVMYFTERKVPALLVPGGILTVIGLLFFFEVATSWTFAGYTWPVYLIAVAFGLYQFYINIGRPKGILIAITVLAIVAIVSICVMVLGAFVSVMQRNIIVPVALIVIGVFILINGFKTKKK
jgi:hypothetical protein